MYIRIIPELTEEDKIRFWSKVNIKGENECWNWLGTIDFKTNYGMFFILTNESNSKIFLAHRIAYFLNKNLDPRDYLVCHTCDNKKCCNINHLFLGTHSDNMQDCISKNRKNMPTGELNHKSKLTKIQVKEIREKRLLFNTSYRKLAKEYCVYYTVICKICNYEIWRDI